MSDIHWSMSKLLSWFKDMINCVLHSVITCTLLHYYFHMMRWTSGCPGSQVVSDIQVSVSWSWRTFSFLCLWTDRRFLRSSAQWVGGCGHVTGVSIYFLVSIFPILPIRWYLCSYWSVTFTEREILDDFWYCCALVQHWQNSIVRSKLLLAFGSSRCNRILILILVWCTWAHACLGCAFKGGIWQKCYKTHAAIVQCIMW